MQKMTDFNRRCPCEESPCEESFALPALHEQQTYASCLLKMSAIVNAIISTWAIGLQPAHVHIPHATQACIRGCGPQYVRLAMQPHLVTSGNDGLSPLCRHCNCLALLPFGLYQIIRLSESVCKLPA